MSIILYITLNESRIGDQMSFEEKNTWAFLFIAIAAYLCYLVIVLVTAGGRELVEVDYGPVMLSTIGGAIVAGILANIVIAIVSPKTAGKADQRDKEISRFGDHVGQAFVVIGAVVAMLLAIVRFDYRRGFQPW
jgi:hypothetical protein